MNNPNIGHHPRLMGNMPSVKKQEIEKNFIDNLSETIKKTRKIRDNVIKSQAHYYIEGDPIRTSFVLQNWEARAKEMEKCYNEIEKLAKDLPKLTPGGVPNFDLLGKYLDEASVDIFTMATADRSRDEAITAIYTEQYCKVAGELMAPMQSIRNRSKWYTPEISDFNTRIKPKTEFYKAFKEAVTIDNEKASRAGFKTPRIVEKCLEESFNRMIIEVHIVTPSSKDPFKLLVLVNNNEISLVNMYPFAEDYTYIDDARTKIDVFASSKSELHRALTQTLNSNYQAYANTNLGPYLKQNMSPMAQKITYIFSLATRLGSVFTTSCKVCGKFLKNGMPPIVIDVMTRTVNHEDCR